MVLEATAKEVEDIITAEGDVSAHEIGEKAVAIGALTEMDIRDAIGYLSSGDTLSLAEHHIYGSSRLGVQRYDSVQIANLVNLPGDDAVHIRTMLNDRSPWYSYAYADLIDQEKRREYDGTVNTHVEKLTANRTLGRRYYELTDHLGNVLATVLDRKTGYKTSPGATLYDHWSADLAQVSDYYPGGMMMPGRNLEWDWSRMGYNGQAKDDEVYGKGNLNTAQFWEYDTRRLGRWNIDPESNVWESSYAVFGGNPVKNTDVNGDSWTDVVVGAIVGAVTNVIPGSGGLRDLYTPDDSREYNNTLRNSDNVYLAAGAMAVGGGSATAAAGLTASATGVGAVVGAPAAATGAVVAASGAVVMYNAVGNKADGYNRGKQQPKPSTTNDQEVKRQSEQQSQSPGTRRQNRIPDKGEPNSVQTNKSGTTTKKYGPDGNVQKEYNDGHQGRNVPRNEQQGHIHDYKPNPQNPTGRGTRMPGRQPKKNELKKDFGK